MTQARHSKTSVTVYFKVTYYLFSYCWRHKRLLWKVYIKIRPHRTCSLICVLHCPHFHSRLYLKCFFILQWKSIFSQWKATIYLFGSERVWPITTQYGIFTLYRYIAVKNIVRKGEIACNFVLRWAKKGKRKLKQRRWEENLCFKSILPVNVT